MAVSAKVSIVDDGKGKHYSVEARIAQHVDGLQGGASWHADGVAFGQDRSEALAHLRELLAAVQQDIADQLAHEEA